MRSRFDSPADTAFAASQQADKLPTACPACQSTSIVTTAKNPDADSYWRCKDCGEVWNAARCEVGRARSSRWG